MTKEQRLNQDLMVAKKVVQAIKEAEKIEELWISPANGCVGYTTRRINPDLTVEMSKVIYKGEVIARLNFNTDFGSTEAWDIVHQAFADKGRDMTTKAIEEFLSK